MELVVQLRPAQNSATTVTRFNYVFKSTIKQKKSSSLITQIVRQEEPNG